MSVACTTSVDRLGNERSADPMENQYLLGTGPLDRLEAGNLRYE